MSMLMSYPGFERLLPFALFTLYMVTSVKVCRYSSWMQAGAPNPFLPPRIKLAVSRAEIAYLLNGEVRAARSRIIA